MKKIKRLLTIGVAVALMFCMSLSFVGCKKEPVIGPIPDGIYGINGPESFIKYIYTESNEQGHYWIIQGDNAESWTSGFLGKKAKIVEKDGKIYFECYKWFTVSGIITDLIFGNIPKGEGSTNIYLVEYNPEERSIFLELYEKGE